MPKQQHHPKQLHGLNGKANYDVDKHRINNESGEVVDRRNVRVNAMDGNNASNVKINGEELKYSTNQSGDWFCIGATYVKDNLVEFWVDKLEVTSPIIRVNGIVVCQSDNLPFTADYPLQMDTNDNCIGGEVYVTDNNSNPLLFNIDDMLKNAGENGGTATNKYFSEFNINNQVLALKASISVPVFKGMTSDSSDKVIIGDYSGLVIGYHQYSFRYVTEDGERTQWSPLTPLCPAVNTGVESYFYPGLKTQGGVTGERTNNGAWFSIRINKEIAYEAIEIRRVSFENDNLLDSGVAGIIHTEDITSYGDYEVINFLDKGSDIIETLDLEDATQSMAVIEKAKSIRYFNNKLYLFNVTYADRDVTDSVSLVESDNNNFVYSITENVGKQGHNDTVNAAYKKEYMGGERYSFGIQFYDSTFERSFVWTPDTDSHQMNNFLMPTRRERMSSDSSSASYGKVSTVADDGFIRDTFEKFNVLDNGVSKLNSGDLVYDKINITTQDSFGALTPRSIDQDNRFLPEGEGGHHLQPTLYVHKRQFEIGTTTRERFRPKGFRLDYFLQGMALHGIDEMPDWATAFSVVRTEPANRVVASGLAYYDFQSQDEYSAGSYASRKNKNKFRFYSPDLDGRISLDPTIISDLEDNPGNYQVEIVAPFGTFTEYYTAGTAQPLDAVTYPRVIKDDGNINPLDELQTWGVNESGNTNHVAFGQWRKASPFTYGMFRNGANKLKNDGVDINITAASTVYPSVSGSEERSSYLEITIDNNIFYDDSLLVSASNNVHSTDSKSYNEPVYIVNIIKKDKQVSQTENQEFVGTGHLQYVESIIGESDGTESQSFPISGERWEDFLQDIRDINTGNKANTGYSSEERFITVKDSFGNSKKWIDVTWKNTSQREAILDDITNNGFYSTTNASGDSVNVYGIYRVFIGNDNTINSVIFDTDMNTNGYDDNLLIPTSGSKIIVEYDKGIPVRFFGGDTWLGESVYCPYDIKFDAGGNPPAASETYNGLGIPFPFADLTSTILIPVSGNAVLASDSVSDDNFVNASTSFPNSIRQLLVMFTCQSRVNTNFCYGDAEKPYSQSFPEINYIQRPSIYNTTSLASNSRIRNEYGQVYGEDEFNRWGWGGFRNNQLVNTQYSHEDNFRTGFSKPDRIEVKNKFCTRGIWSLPNTINVQDSPNIRTFLNTNAFDFTDDTGEIKYAFDDLSTSGGELTVFTENGIIRAIVDKRLLTEVSGGTLSAIGGDTTGILQQILVNSDIGMNDEMWRTAAEYGNVLFFANSDSVYSYTAGQIKDIARTGYHYKIYSKLLQNIKPGFTNQVAAIYDRLHNEYWLTARFNGLTEEIELESSIEITSDSGSFKEDVGNNIILEFSNKLAPDGSTISPKFINLNYNLSADVFYVKVTDTSNTYILSYKGYTSFLGYTQLQQSLTANKTYRVEKFSEANEAFVVNEDNDYNPTVTKTFVYSPFLNNGDGGWVGEYDYTFDRYISFNNTVYGLRDLETYTLDKGSQINSADIPAEISVACNAEPFARKEFIRVCINSDNKPETVEFFDDFDNFELDSASSTLDTTSNPRHLKEYDGYEGYIPRKDSGDRSRQQGRYLIYKITNTSDEDFEVSSVITQYKLIK